MVSHTRVSYALMRGVAFDQSCWLFYYSLHLIIQSVRRSGAIIQTTLSPNRAAKYVLS